MYSSEREHYDDILSLLILITLQWRNAKDIHDSSEIWILHNKYGIK